MVRFLRRTAFLVAASFCTTAATAEVAANVAGLVEDSSGAVIAGAYVLIHPDPVGDTGPALLADKNVSTDRIGFFSLTLSPGVYDVCVMSMAFEAQCHKIQVADQHPLRLKFLVKSSPLVQKMIADPVY